ncbi:hypothetical protein [Ferrimonas marina]|nr:hypothetical protein [Ferrimonas marina]
MEHNINCCLEFVVMSSVGEQFTDQQVTNGLKPSRVLKDPAKASELEQTVKAIAGITDSGQDRDKATGQDRGISPRGVDNEKR